MVLGIFVRWIFDHISEPLDYRRVDNLPQPPDNRPFASNLVPSPLS